MKTWQYALIGITAVLVFVVLIVLILQDTGGPGFSGEDGAVAGEGRDTRSDNYFAEPFFSGENADPEFILSQYKEYAVYPPHSRPLKREMVDLIEPNKRYENFLPVGGPPPGFDRDNPPKNPPKAEHYYLLTGDRYYVIGDGSITFTLQAASLPTVKAEPVSLKILTASVNKGRSHLKYTKVMDVRFNDSGSDGDVRAGDMIYTCRIQPSATTLANYHGRLQIYAKFDVGGTITESLVPFEYFPASTIPARFNGRFADSIKDGSLLIRAGLDVQKAGYYIIDANLMDRESSPIAYTRFKGELQAGPQEVELLFFGKVIIDQEGEAPFYLRDLRGYRLLEGQFPDRQMIPSYESTYRTTGRYSDTSVFSEKEWESPRKQAKIEFLKKEIESGVTMPPAPLP